MPVQRFHSPRVDSTHSEAECLLPLFSSRGAGVLFQVSADFQSAGRGRGTRQWVAPLGTSSLSSVVVRLPRQHVDSAHWLTALSALSVLEALEQLFPSLCGDVAVKWPNDVEIRGRKVAGILATVLAPTSDGHAESAWVDVACGVGLNVSTAADELATAHATSLACSGVDPLPSCDAVTATWASALDARVSAWSASAYSSVSVREEFSSHLSTVGRPVRVSAMDGSDSPVVHGTMVGIDDRGYALVRTEDALLSFSAADMSLTPED